MPWQGSTFSRSISWEQERIDGETIDADTHDNHDSDLASGIEQCLRRDGGNSASASINMGGYRIRNVGEPTSSGDAVALITDDGAAKLPALDGSLLTNLSFAGASLDVTDITYTYAGEPSFVWSRVDADPTDLKLRVSGVSDVLYVSGDTAAVEFKTEATFEQGVNISDGSVSAPGLAFDSDATTGIYRTGTIAGFAASSQAAWTVDSSAIVRLGFESTNTTPTIKVTPVASMANYLGVTGSATGVDVTIEALGSDTDIDLAITPKGAGKVVIDGSAWPNGLGTNGYVLGTNGAGVLSWVAGGGGGGSGTPGDPVPLGYEVTSSDPALIIAPVASQVNQVTITGSTTGNDVAISTTGDDTDIDLAITPKGDGKIVLDGLNFPIADGTSGQALITNGSGQLSFSDSTATPSIAFGTLADANYTLQASDLNKVYTMAASTSRTITLDTGIGTANFVKVAQIINTGSAAITLGGFGGAATTQALLRDEVISVNKYSYADNSNTSIATDSFNVTYDDPAVNDTYLELIIGYAGAPPGGAAQVTTRQFSATYDSSAMTVGVPPTSTKDETRPGVAVLWIANPSLDGTAKTIAIDFDEGSIGDKVKSYVAFVKLHSGAKQTATVVYGDTPIGIGSGGVTIATGSVDGLDTENLAYFASVFQGDDGFPTTTSTNTIIANASSNEASSGDNITDVTLTLTELTTPVVGSNTFSHTYGSEDGYSAVAYIVQSDKNAISSTSGVTQLGGGPRVIGINQSVVIEYLGDTDQVVTGLLGQA